MAVVSGVAGGRDELLEEIELMYRRRYPAFLRLAVAITRDEHTGLYLFPDAPSTLDRLQKLRAGELERLAFDTELGS